MQSMVPALTEEFVAASICFCTMSAPSRMTYHSHMLDRDCAKVFSFSCDGP